MGPRCRPVDASGSTTPTSQTPLAGRLLPPGKRGIAGKIVVLLLLAAWFWVVPDPPNWIEPSRMAAPPSGDWGIPRLLFDNSPVFALILVALCPIYLLKRNVSYNRHEYPAHCHSWWERAYCRRCDSTFQTET